jgi:hypothetical protein
LGSKIDLPTRQQTVVFWSFLTILRRNEQGFARSFWPGFLFGPGGPEHGPENWEPVFREDYAQTKENFRFSSTIRKSGSRFSGEIALKTIARPEEEP